MNCSTQTILSQGEDNSPDASKPIEDHIPAITVLGFTSNPGTIADYLTLIDQAVRQQATITVLYHNLHSLYSYFTSDQLRQCYDKCIVLVDGMPLIGLLRLAGFSVIREQRITYVDFIWPMLTHARDNNLRVFHVGQSEPIQQEALRLIRDRVPGIQISGHDGYFDLTDNCPQSLDVIKACNDFGTDLLLVGFGAPKQEFWVHAHRSLIRAPALLTCGACMEYVAGAVKTPPRWMGRVGLEWSYRLFENPRRFAYRYLVEPILLSLILLRNLALPRFRLGKKPNGRSPGQKGL